MKRLLKALGALFALLVVAGLLLFGYAWFKTERDLAQTYVVADPPLVMAMDDASRARGAHLFTVQGCNECHGEGGIGHELFDAGPVARIVAPNITPTKLRDRYDADRLAAAIRHGVKPDGTPLRFMPVGDFHELSDADTAALVAHVQALAPSDNDPGQLEIRPLGRVLAVMGKFNLTPAAKLDHTPRARTAPPAGPTAEYGAYLAHGCTGCHGEDFSGGHATGIRRRREPDAARRRPGKMVAGRLRARVPARRTARRTRARPLHAVEGIREPQRR